MGKTALLFAGQGSQFPGMGKDFYENYPEFRKVFNLLPAEQREIAFSGSREQLKETVNTQPILLAFGVGIYEVLKSGGFRPDMAAGLSLGEYSALTAAGVFTPEQALSLIHCRAEAMAQASAGVETEMSAILGLGRDKLMDCLRRAASTGRVEAANFNCPGQIVISGERAAVEETERLAKEAGARRCMRLPVSGPFHTSWMKPAAEVMKQRFQNESFGRMKFPVYFNCTGKPEKAADGQSEAELISGLLVRQVQSSVYMEDTIRNMISAGADRFIEIGPGKTLSGFVRRTDRSVQTVSITSSEDLEAFLGE
ncbi:MAG: ACP S-malonyltransferase [Eubacterium sp.]